MKPIRTLTMAGGLIAATACNDAPRPLAVVGTTMADSAEQVIQGFHSTITEKGIRRGDLFADTAYIFDDQTRFVLRVVHLSFTKDDGSPNGTIRADKGEYSMRTQILDGWGNVVVTTADGRTLRTPQLRYSKVANLISSDTSFVWTEKDRVQSGVGFRADPGLDTVRILTRARGSGAIATPPER